MPFSNPCATIAPFVHLVRIGLAAMQEQAKAARQAAAGTMDEYTFVGEDSRQGGGLSGAAPQQGLSAEQQYKAEMQQELQVCPAGLPCLHCAVACRMLLPLSCCCPPLCSCPVLLLPCPAAALPCPVVAPALSLPCPVALCFCCCPALCFCPVLLPNAICVVMFPLS